MLIPVKRVEYWNPNRVDLSCSRFFSDVVNAVDNEISLVDKLTVLHDVESDLCDAWFTGRISEFTFKIAIIIVDSIMIAYLGMPYGFYCASIENNCDECVYKFQCQSTKASLYYNEYQSSLLTAKRRARSIVDGYHQSYTICCSIWDTYLL